MRSNFRRVCGSSEFTESYADREHLMADGLNRLLGDTPGRTVIKLLVLSVVAGFVMSMLNVTPWDLVSWIERGVRDLWRSGFAALGRTGEYLVIGAMVVVPAWLLIRLLNWRKS
jgi:Family of unknown function (DUF6460)